MGEMLSSIGKRSVDELFADIPDNVKLKGLKGIPDGCSEVELKNGLASLSRKNAPAGSCVSFLGAGSCEHFMPSVVNHIISRSEFYTAYTPYQPEMSQGILQAIFEYQSMICDLTGMDAANASMYDGATALAEAVSASICHTGKKKVLISKAVHPNYRQVVRTYGEGFGWEILELDYDNTGVTDIKVFEKMLDDKVACVVLANPNFFGNIENIKVFTSAARSKGIMSIVSVDPISLGILKRPGDLGADIVTGEGQSLGLPRNFGGPCLGIFAVKKEYLRLMPGRIVGETIDKEGRRGYVLTLQAREQHIRREKASSNICSNEALCALAAAVYLAVMGKQGLREVANQCLQKANYLKEKISRIKGYSIAFKAPSFKEFVVKAPSAIGKINRMLAKKSIIGGLDLGQYYPEFKNHMLLCVTELTKKEGMDKLASLL